MNSESIKLKDIKKMRLERHWSQEQLADMSGLSIRTIQRIEKGENAGLESLKALAAVFEIQIEDEDKQKKMEQIKKEEAYIQNVKGMYMIIAVGVFSMAPLIIGAFSDPSMWKVIPWIAIPWVITIVAYWLNAFDVFGKDWEQRMIDKKFKKK